MCVCKSLRLYLLPISESMLLQRESGEVWMKFRRYIDDDWDVVELLVMKAPIPEGVYPKRLDPRWVYENGSRKGQRLAGCQVVDLDKWDDVLSNNSGIGGMLLHPRTREFYMKFKEDLKNRIIPFLVRPTETDGPGTLQKLITFMQDKAMAPVLPLHVPSEVIEGLSIREQQDYVKPYTGRHVNAKKQNLSQPVLYIPEAGDFIMVKIEGGGMYNPRGVPELGMVMEVIEEKRSVKVHWWWSTERTHHINKDFVKMARNIKNHSSIIDVETVLFFGINMIQGLSKNSKRFNKATLKDIRAYMKDHSIEFLVGEELDPPIPGKQVNLGDNDQDIEEDSSDEHESDDEPLWSHTN